VARKYGRREVFLTARQGIEIPRVRFCDIEAARKELAEAGLALGPCGPHFRTVSACPTAAPSPWKTSWWPEPPRRSASRAVEMNAKLAELL